MFKDLDRTSILIVAICLILLFSWNYIFGPSGLNLLPQQPKQSSEVQKTQPQNVSKPEQTAVSATETVRTQAEPAVNVQSAAKPEPASAIKELPPVTLEDSESSFKVTINPNAGAVSGIELTNVLDSHGKQQVVLNKDISPAALSVNDRNANWHLVKIFPMAKTRDSLTLRRQFRYDDGRQFILVQSWKLAGAYTISYSISLQNISSEVLRIPELDVWAGGMPPVEFLSGDIARSEAHRIDALLENGTQFWSLKADSKELINGSDQNDSVLWVAVSNKYFADILKVSDKDKAFFGGNLNQRTQATGKDPNGKDVPYNIVFSAGRIKNVVVPVNGTCTWDYTYYSGPKEINVLKAFEPKSTEIMHLAFTSLETIAQWLLYLLIYMKGLTGNYGWAIILLTVLVKLVFWPITHKSNVSMKRMQKLQPQMKELREQYKDDKQKLNQKMMELYKKEKVNPLGGCLPILVQIPVFFALYWTLDGAIELRHSSFLWIADLTKPDTVGYIFGFPIHPLAIAMALTMFLQQKMTPTASMDPTQAKMMLFMPLIMVIFLYYLPSGLTLYWTVSQVISIIQLLHNKYSDKKEREMETKKGKQIKTTAKEKKK